MATYSGSGVDDQGNTINFVMTAVIAPAPLYVALHGNDANNGRSPSTPFKTIDKLNAIILARGGQVLFNGADAFVGNFKPNIDGNGLQSSPLIIGSYGTGRATIMPAFGGETGIVDIDRMSGVVVQDLILTAPDITKMPRGGVLIRNNSDNRTGGVTVQRCDISGIRYGEATGYQGGEVFVEGYPGTGGIENVLIQGNLLHGRDGIASRDDVGVASFGNGRNIFNMIQRGNLCYHIGGSSMLPVISPTQQGYGPMGDGLDFDGVEGGLSEFNIIHDNAWNYTNQGGGPCAILTSKANGITIQFNEGYNIQPNSVTVDGWRATGQGAADYVGLDLDNDSTNCVGQFNYMHDNFNSGIMLFANEIAGGGSWNNNTLRKNLCVNNCKSGQYGFGEINVSIQTGSNPTVHVDDNITYNDRVYTGQLYKNMDQGAAGLSFNAEGNFQGTIQRNLQVMSKDAHTLWMPINGRKNRSDWAPSATISANQWVLRGEWASVVFWWGQVMYQGWQDTDDFTLQRWQTASGKGPNTVSAGSPNIFPTYALALTAAERTIAADALAAIVSLAGIDIVGPRADALRTRLLAGDSPVTLPEYIALGFGLVRADTVAGNALLARTKALVQS